MNIQQINSEYHTLCLKNKLQTNLKYHLLGSTKSYDLLYRIIEILKIKYNETIDIINDLNILKQNIYNYSFGHEILQVENWIFNWNNIKLINDLNKFVDTSRNYELEEQIKNLQKQIDEVKEINLNQNPYIERIDENTSI
jgi:ATP-dependent Lon protease